MVPPEQALLAPSTTALIDPSPVAADGSEHTGALAAERRISAVVVRVVWALVGLGLFVGALGIMKAGAQSLYSTLQGSAFTDNAWSTLGLGWLGACLVLSGSPVAASSLTFLDGGVIDRSQAFTMLTGSRLGASFVVLVVGFIYALRHKGGGRRAPVSIGILSLTMTVFAYLPGALLGWLLLRGGAFDGLTLTAPPTLLSLTDTAFGWLADIAKHVVPGWGLFPVGLAVLLVAFKAFDHALPNLSAERLEGGGASAWFRKPWAMFALGCVVALMTLSVSVALTLLVPLVAKGHLKREDALPYIAGANITTLADTLVAAMLVSNPDAARVVLAEMVGVTAWTLVLIGFMYPTVRRSALGIARKVVSSRSRLAVSLACLFSVPLLLVAV
jgi:solute carrier family 34 (sodium-dependent phosphate cotransporter)